MASAVHSMFTDLASFDCSQVISVLTKGEAVIKQDRKSREHDVRVLCLVQQLAPRKLSCKRFTEHGDWLVH